MEMTLNIRSALEKAKNLSKDDLSVLADKIMEMMAAMPAKNQKKRRDLCEDLGITKASEKPDCPHCAAKASLGYIIKRPPLCSEGKSGLHY